MRAGLTMTKGERYGLLLFLSPSLLTPSMARAHQAPAVVSGPALTVVLTSWTFRADIFLVLAVLAGAYTLGWWRLRQRGHRGSARGWVSAAYLAGLTVLSLALFSPIEGLASVLFTMHMVQHLLLIMVAAPLLLLANPLPAFLWALPRSARHRVGHLLAPGGAVRRGLWALTWMPVAWLVFVVNLWAWHHPAAYQAALRNTYIHDLEHLAFFGTALLFWWPIINPAPKVHGRIHLVHLGLHLLYFGAATGQNVLLGALIALTERVLYPFYAAAPRLWELSAQNDQALGGGIMWVAAHMYLLPILLVVGRMLGEEERVMRQREAEAYRQSLTAQHPPLAPGTATRRPVSAKGPAAPVRPAPQAQQRCSYDGEMKV